MCAAREVDVAHVLEPATSSRARCRGCGRLIEQGTLRFGERMPNSYGEGEMTLWLHPLCAAYKRPEPLLAALQAPTAAAGELPQLAAIARRTLQHERLTRIDGAERAASGQARCRHCREPIARGSWRVRLVFHDEGGRFNPGGFIHLACASAYFEAPAPLEQLLHFSRELSAEERADLAGLMAGNTP